MWEMSILFSNEILESVKDELINASESVQIITAYCKESSLLYLNQYINSSVSEKKLLVRFRMDDVIKGSTDFSILDYAISEGWKAYIRFDLHAKTYIIDKKRGLVGSANATNSGLSIGKLGNMEMATLIDIEPKDLTKIDGLFADAIEVTPIILEKLRKQIITIDEKGGEQPYVWSDEIMDMFIPNVETLFSYEFPDNNQLINGEYYQFLDSRYEGDISSFKEEFRYSNSFQWLLGVLRKNKKPMRFGEISARLHNDLISDPKPYRKDVKVLLSNLLGLIEQLDMEEICITRPNYTQVISLREK